MAHELAWQGLEDRTLREDTEAKIALRQALLADLSDGYETLAARAELHYTIGGLYWAGRRYEQAGESLNAALEAARRTGNCRLESWCHYGLGNVYADQGRQEEAVAEYQRAIELDPQGALPHHGLGNVYVDQGRQEEAVAAYQRAIELDPKLAAPHHGLGNVYRSLGRQEEAVAEYRRAIEFDPQDASSHHELGTVYRLLGRQEEAVAAYQRAIDLDPSPVVPYLGLAGAYRRLGEAKESARYAILAQERLPVDDWYNRACLEAVAGRVEEALHWLARALVETPKLRVWAQRDPDFHELRKDPRFWQVVGEPPMDPGMGE
jgi:tetratricopeptide (TPR) repeat protein